jgi:hypothetical protein
MWWFSVAAAGGPEEPACDEVPGTTWAARVVSFTVGPNVEPAYADPTNALGPPDFHEGAGAVSLGNRVVGGAELVVAFGAAALVDGPGADLVIHEQGPSAEPTELAVSADGVTWYDVGTIGGAIRDLDLKGRVPRGVRFGLVRLRTASGRSLPGPWAGPDVDAVGLLHACASRRLDT